MAATSSDTRLRVAVLYGGRSVEHAISIITALEVMKALDASRYIGVPVYVAPDGRWYTGDALLDARFYVASPQPVAQVTEVALLPVPGVGGLTVRKPARQGLFGRAADVIPVDVYLPVFHGTYGEDGCAQGLFELADVAYTGSNVPAAALGMNKHLSKIVVAAHGVPVLPGARVQRADFMRDLAGTRSALLAHADLARYPLIVKPCSLGSSVGVRKADSAAELDAALDLAFRYDTQVLVEPCVVAKREINVAVYDGDGPARASVVETPISGELLDYGAKYLQGAKKKAAGAGGGMGSLRRRIDPEDLAPQHKQSAADYAVRAYQALGCSGIARIDFILDTSTEKLYFNEINTLPGSLAYYLWAESHPPLLYTSLLNGLLDRALARKADADRNERKFGFEALAPLLK